MGDGNDSGQEAARGDEDARQERRAGRGWFLTAFLALLLIVIAVVIYLVKFRSMEFFYVLF